MSTINLNELRDRAYKIARDHGFHDADWSNEHLLCLVISELMEAVEADRNDSRANMIGFETCIKNAYQGIVRDDWFLKAYRADIKGSVEEELSDVTICLLDLAGLRKIDLSELQGPLFDKFNITPEFISWKSQIEEMSFTERIFCLCSLLTSRESIEDVVRSSIVIIFLHADILGIDLLWHIDQKIKYNTLRPVMHGKKY
jgi:NTP pyrophosphatase (non-canonical NTP hydrolase)